MKKLWLALFVPVLIFAGCSHSSSSTNQSQQNVTMQAGQWEFALVPTGGNAGNPIMIEANLTASGSPPTAGGALLFQPSNMGFCGNSFALYGTISGSTLSGPLAGSGGVTIVSLNGSIASNGRSVSGNYDSSAGFSCGTAVQLPAGTGTFTANTVSPLNGTYAGTLSWTGQRAGRTDQINITMSQNASFSQDSSFGITADGTDNCSSSNASSPCPAPSMTLHASPTGSSVIGALLSMNVTATYSNGSQSLSWIASFDQAGQNLTINPCCGGLSGTLVKQ